MTENNGLNVRERVLKWYFRLGVALKAFAGGVIVYALFGPAALLVTWVGGEQVPSAAIPTTVFHSALGIGAGLWLMNLVSQMDRILRRSERQRKLGLR